VNAPHHEFSAEGSPREYRLFSALDDQGLGQVRPEHLRRDLLGAGLDPSDARLAEVFAGLEAAGDAALDFPAFSRVIAPAGLLVERALQGTLAIADFDRFRARVAGVFAEAAQNRGGDQARYIPPLADANPEQFGMAIVSVDGQALELGDSGVDFSIQSTCKPFNYSIALEDLGEAAVHRHIGREPSGQRFNAYVLQEDARPHNPMINAGAIMCCALIKRELLQASGAPGGEAVHLAEDTAEVGISAVHGDPETVVELLWAAALGDLGVLRRLVALGVPLHAADYDGRTALHLAAAEGQLAAAHYLLAHGHPVSCRDRWGASPLDEAKREHRPEVLTLLQNLTRRPGPAAPPVPTETPRGPAE
jgi:hypothetical protein